MNASATTSPATFSVQPRTWVGLANTPESVKERIDPKIQRWGVRTQTISSKVLDPQPDGELLPQTSKSVRRTNKHRTNQPMYVNDTIFQSKSAKPNSLGCTKHEFNHDLHH